MAVRDMPPTATDDIAIHIEQCNDLPVDLAEASLVWPAGELGISEVDLPTKPRPVFTAGDFGLHAGGAHEGGGLARRCHGILRLFPLRARCRP